MTTRRVVEANLAGARGEIARRILGADAALDTVLGDFNVLLLVAELFAASDEKLFFD